MQIRFVQYLDIKVTKQVIFSQGKVPIVTRCAVAVKNMSLSGTEPHLSASKLVTSLTDLSCLPVMIFAAIKLMIVDSTRHFEFTARKKCMGFHLMTVLMEKMKRCVRVTSRGRVMTVMTCQMLEPGDRREETFTTQTM